MRGLLNVLLIILLVSVFFAVLVGFHGESLASTDATDRFVAVSASGMWANALTENGDVWSWGYEMTGSIVYTPVEVPISNVKAIATGAGYALALKDDGTVWAWGENYYGGLGDGNNVTSNTPVEVLGLTNVTAIATGNDCSYALKDDGTLWAWGFNRYGQLGDGTYGDNTSNFAPVKVEGLENVIAIGAGGDYAIESDGSVWAWGDNTAYAVYGMTNVTRTYGALGDDYQGIRATPFKLENVSNVKAIAYSWTSPATFAVKPDGTVLAWGLDMDGQLGNPELDQGSQPSADSQFVPNVYIIPVSVDIDNVTEVSAGENYAMALKADGTVWEWGQRDDNIINDGSYTTPTQIQGLSGITAISAGGTFRVALKNDGSVWTWGDNEEGQLGDGNNNITEPYRATPMEILGGNAPVQVATPTTTPIPSTTPEGTPTTATSTVTPAIGNNTSTPIKISGFDLEIAGLAGILLIMGAVVYLWTKKRL
jgi:alpha-tubulin suppressor-like RCC1 family protein